jgi:hypothetical protein
MTDLASCPLVSFVEKKGELLVFLRALRGEKEIRVECRMASRGLVV